MALTEIPIELSSTPSIVDNGNATAITIGSDESTTFNNNVGIGTSSINSFSGYTTLEINNATSGALLDLSQGDSMRGRFIATATTMALETSGSIPIIFQPAGTERLRITSAGLVGIGTSSPSALMHLKATNNAYTGGFRLEGTDETSALAITHINGDNYFSGNATDDHLVLTGTGNVGIGQPAPYNNSKLDVVGSIISTSQTIGTYAANNAGFDYAAGTKIGRFFSTSSDATGGHMTFITGASGGAERMRISSAGEIFAFVQYTGGFGAQTTGGTASFDHSSNARAGNAYTLIQGTATGGPGGTAYYHVFNYEYESKNSTGNMTQLAYGYNDAKAYMRYRYSGTWSSWVALH
jgi:hypothetical protein